MFPSCDSWKTYCFPVPETPRTRAGLNLRLAPALFGNIALNRALPDVGRVESMEFGPEHLQRLADLLRSQLPENGAQASRERVLDEVAFFAGYV